MSIRKPESMAHSLSHEVEEFSRGRKAVIRPVTQPAFQRPRPPRGFPARLPQALFIPTFGAPVRKFKKHAGPLPFATQTRIAAKNVSKQPSPRELQRRLVDVAAHLKGDLAAGAGGEAEGDVRSVQRNRLSVASY